MLFIGLWCICSLALGASPPGWFSFSDLRCFPCVVPGFIVYVCFWLCALGLLFVLFEFRCSQCLVSGFSVPLLLIVGLTYSVLSVCCLCVLFPCVVSGFLGEYWFSIGVTHSVVCLIVRFVLFHMCGLFVFSICVSG